MHERLTYERIVDILLQKVPGVREVEDVAGNRELPQVVFGAFGTYLNDRLATHAMSDSEVQASFELLNEMASSSDWQVANLARTAVYEVLVDSPASVEAARRHLYGRAIEDFEQILARWGGRAEPA